MQTHFITLSEIPRVFHKPLFVSGQKTDYIAVPTKQQLNVKKQIDYTGFQLRRIDSKGIPMPRVRMSKKTKLRLRRAAK